jgi:hypothetical protein
LGHSDAFVGAQRRLRWGTATLCPNNDRELVKREARDYFLLGWMGQSSSTARQVIVSRMPGIG